MIIGVTSVGSLMARRKSSKRRRRTTTNLSLIGLAETAIIGSAATKMLFNVNLASFLTGVTSGSNQGTGFFPSSDGGSRITLPELLGFTSTGWSADAVGGTYNSTGTHTSFTDAVFRNAKENALPAIATAFFTPIAFKFMKKTFRKPITMVNRQLKGTGVRL